MKVGDRVLVHVHWSSFHGMRGVVESVAPLMIKLDGDKFAMRFGDREVMVEDAPTLPMVGGAA